MIWPFGRKQSAQPPGLLTFSHPVTFIASPYKTATTSVGKALITLKVHRSEMPYKRGMLARHRDTFRQANRIAGSVRTARRFFETHVDEVRQVMAGVMPDVSPYDLFSDAPLGHVHLHPFVRRAIAPDSKFIWVHRDEADWIASVRRWEESHPDLYPRHVHWTTDPPRRPRELRGLWKRSLKHFVALEEMFPHDCLQIGIGDLGDYEKLAAFYGVDAPEKPLKRYNVTAP